MAVIDLTPARLGVQIGQGPRARGGVQIAERSAADPLGQAVGQLGQTMGVLAEATQKARSEQALAQARVQALTGLSTLRGRLEQGDLGTDFTTAYDREAGRLVEEIAGGIPDQAARAAFMRETTLSVARDRLEVVRFSARRTSESGRAALSTQLDDLAQAASSEADPLRRNDRIAEAGRRIDAAVAASFLPADDAVAMRRQFASRLDQAAALRLIAANPGAAAQALANPQMFPNLDPLRREQMALSALSASEARATRAAAEADRQERRGERAAQARADDAEKNFNDAARAVQQAQTAEERAAAEPAMRQALDVLRRDGRPGAYAAAADRVFGTNERPASPQQSAWLEGRLRDRGTPLTRQELEQARANRAINDSTYRAGLERLSQREDARFSEAEAFVRRALPVPSPAIADRDLQPWQREARAQADRIINDLVIERRRNPDVDPLSFVEQRLSAAQDPARVVEQQRAVTGLSRLPPEAQTLEGLDDISRRWAEYELARQNRGWFSSNPTPPRLSSGLPVTADWIARARRLHEQAGTAYQGAPPR